MILLKQTYFVMSYTADITQRASSTVTTVPFQPHPILFLITTFTTRTTAIYQLSCTFNAIKMSSF